MPDFFQNALSFVIAIGVLVAFHEFGHFWVAQRLGVKVLRFSIGMGQPLLRRQKSPEDTEFVIAALPLGGYVRMVDEREGQVAERDLPFAFNRQPLWARASIVAAGPLFNLLLAFLLLALYLMIGYVGLKPVLGEVTEGSLAARAGFHQGEEIVSVNHTATPTWNHVINEVYVHVLDHEIPIEVTDRRGITMTRWLSIPQEVAQNPDLLKDRLGLQLPDPEIPPILGDLVPDGPAAKAGLNKGDRIIAADSAPMPTWQTWVKYVQGHPEQRIQVEVQRGREALAFTVIPRSEQQGERTVGKIGAAVFPPSEDLLAQYQTYYRLGFFPAIVTAAEQTGTYSWLTLKMIGRLVTGRADVKNLSGPLSIAYYAGESAKVGVGQFLKFLALTSISLGVLNLLPIPILDGGHLLVYACEGVRGRPLSEQVIATAQRIGLYLLISIMVLALMVDLSRWLS